MSNKNPYEIRLEVLKMAQDLQLQHYHMNRETFMRNWEIEADTARNEGKTIPKLSELPEFPSEQSIVEKAKFLSEYINKNSY